MQSTKENKRNEQYILYIDDPENQISFKALFRRKFPIFTTEQLTEAKKIIRQYPVKLVLSNQRSTDLSPIHLLQWVRQYDENVIRIFVYSNSGQQKSQKISTNYTDLAHQYLWKPWHTKEMESIILKWWYT